MTDGIHKRRGADEKESYGHGFLVIRLHMIRETARDISRRTDVIPPYSV